MRLEIIHDGEIIEARDLGDGSYKIGRSSQCEIQIRSGKISKEHALFVIKGSRAAIIDLGSSNGTFVNGVLVRKQRVNYGDDVAIADYKLRLHPPGAKLSRSGRPQKKAAGSPRPTEGQSQGNLALDMNYEPEEEAKSEKALAPQEKVLQFIDEKVLPPIYQVMKQHDWRLLMGVVLGVLVLGSVLFTLFPVMRWGKLFGSEEALGRAQAIVKQTVRENYRVITKTDDVTRLTVESCEGEKGILSCFVVDPKTYTILAPSKLFNIPIEDPFAVTAMNQVIKEGKDFGSVEKEENLYVVVQPIMRFSQEANDQVAVGLVVAEFAITSSVASIFDAVVTAALIAILLGLVAYFFLFKLINYPVISMAEQVDAALKGDAVNIASKTNFPELESLATQINFSISRWRQLSGGKSGGVQTEDSEKEASEFLRSVQEFEVGTSDGILILDKDKKVRFVGRILEELINMRTQYASGQNISDCCKDQGFAGTVIDLVDNVTQTLGETQSAELDINGTLRPISAVGHKNSVGEISYFLITVKMSNG